MRYQVARDTPSCTQGACSSLAAVAFSGPVSADTASWFWHFFCRYQVARDIPEVFHGCRAVRLSTRYISLGRLPASRRRFTFRRRLRSRAIEEDMIVFISASSSGVIFRLSIRVEFFGVYKPVRPRPRYLARPSSSFRRTVSRDPIRKDSAQEGEISRAKAIASRSKLWVETTPERQRWFNVQNTSSSRQPSGTSPRSFFRRAAKRRRSFTRSQLNVCGSRLTRLGYPSLACLLCCTFAESERERASFASSRVTGNNNSQNVSKFHLGPSAMIRTRESLPGRVFPFRVPTTRRIRLASAAAGSAPRSRKYPRSIL